jgi:hypothetical protein
VTRKLGAVVSTRRRRIQAQRGSALLIVFVFAAMIAIMLYTELPIAVFEAKRQKEQLLIDRGNEYAHAVKLFVRKFGMYPATVDQLESTNRMRFLRHRYKDPFTGKDNWRMLHAGPGGQLIDSKVKQPGLGNTPGIGNTPGSNAGSSFGASTGAGFGSTSSGTAFGSSTPSLSSGFGSSSLGSFGSDKSADAVVVPDLPQRPPAIPAGGAPSAGSGNAAGEAGSAAEAEQNASASTDDLRQQMAAVEQSQAGSVAPENAGAAQSGLPNAAGAGPGSISPNAENNPANQVAAAGATDSQNALTTVRNALGNGNPAIGAPLAGSSATGATGSGMGQLSGGGIAGVASNAHGHSIKTVNDQTDYSLWEFYYDPTKDATRNMPGLATGAQGVQPGLGANGNQGLTPGSTGQSSFQSGSSQSGFGQSGFGQSGSSGFGQSNSGTPPSAPATPSNPPQQ